VRNQLPFSRRSQSIVKEIMRLEKRDGITVSGKTGSCGGIGWFVGFIERDDTIKVFSFQIRGEGANGAEAKKIALEYLK
jgi:beta-lactamase class D